MRVCDACRKPIDDTEDYVELVGPEGQHHFHNTATVACWSQVRDAITQAVSEIRQQS